MAVFGFFCIADVRDIVNRQSNDHLLIVIPSEQLENERIQSENRVVLWRELLGQIVLVLGLEHLFEKVLFNGDVDCIGHAFQLPDVLHFEFNIVLKESLAGFEHQVEIVVVELAAVKRVGSFGFVAA